jgi:hypothetical protein
MPHYGNLYPTVAKYGLEWQRMGMYGIINNTNFIRTCPLDVTDPSSRKDTFRKQAIKYQWRRIREKPNGLQSSRTLLADQKIIAMNSEYRVESYGSRSSFLRSRSACSSCSSLLHTISNGTHGTTKSHQMIQLQGRSPLTRRRAYDSTHVIRNSDI